MAINYIHPSVSSTITDNSTVFVTASGTTKLFAVFTSEKGVDNEIKMITSVSEFEFNYGEPNMRLYGQTSYNIVNWLNSGGVVYCLRVLPEDAGYANAIVNIQTKTSNKIVTDSNGDTVVIENGIVELRPCITYTSVNNTAKTSLEFNELRRSSAITVDGYKNNMLFAVIPKGRGAGYNNLGFRMTLVDSYDLTYEFRLYNFEVTTTSKSGDISTIQGPFLVSLDPDAMSNSGASLFIVDVIDRYCDYFTIIFNEDNYEELAKTINPYVHPNKIDFFNGISRVINDEYETYFDERTKREEDIHISVIKCDNDGNPTDERNIVDVTNEIEGSIIDVDNAYRNEKYNRNKNTFERAKKTLSIIRKNESSSNPTNVTYTSIQLETLDTNLGKGVEYIENDNSIDTLYNKFFNDSKPILESTINETPYNADNAERAYSIANNDMYSLVLSVEKLIENLYEVYDYAKISVAVDTFYATNNSNIVTELYSIESKLKQINIQELNCNKFKNTIIALTDKFNNLEGDVNTINSEKEEFIYELINELNAILKTLKTISDTTESNTFADARMLEIEKYLTTISNEYALMNDEYITIDDYNESLNNCWENTTELLTLSNVKFLIDLVILEFKSYIYNDIKLEIANIKSLIITFVKTVIDNVTSFSYESAKASMVRIENEIEQTRQYTYVTVLQNFDSYIALKYGTDGSIEGKSFDDAEVEKLIIKGYKGSIDDTLTDKDKWPIDMVLDANYSTSIKSAIASLCTEIRNDFIGILDTGFKSSPAEAIEYRKNSINYNNFRLAIFTQDFIINDGEFTGTNIQVTPTYYLASKIPANDNANGIHWNFVGPRRGTVTGYKSISFLPNPEWRERLYNAQVNYIQQDQISTRFNSQLTSQMTVSALSNISCVRTLLRIQRDVEELMKDYQFEFNDSATITVAQSALNGYLSQWLANRACDSISGSVYASAYDRQQKLLRVKIELVFNSIIERIAIDLIVNS